MPEKPFDCYPEGVQTPVQRARYDYKAGRGQDDNPYPRTETNWHDHDAYAFEMHRLWSIDFDKEIRRARGTTMTRKAK